MLVKDIMKRNPMTARPEDSLSLAAQAMIWTGIRHLPVVHEGRLEGVLSERDILSYRAAHPEGDPLRDPVSRAMKAPPKYIEPDASLIEAADRMAAHRIGCLPVLHRGDLVGMITTTDLLSEQVRAAFGAGAAPAARVATAREVMTPSPVRVAEDEFLAQAIAKMSLAGVRHLPVMGAGGKLIGIISDRDIRLHAEDLTRGAPRLRDESLRVSAIMQRDLRTVGPEAPLPVLVSLFTDWRMSALPVVGDGDRLLGIVSYVDVLKALASEALPAWT
ncbi:MAG: CBS domain-containing protein [Deltaproteobacteria bacterium]|nr:CBS domain-containing protein [Deltaproteobacteria bacterium]